MATLPMPQSRYHLHYSQPTAICQDKTCSPCFPCKSCSSTGETCAHHNTPGWFPFIWNTNTENTRCRGWCMRGGGKPQGDEGLLQPAQFIPHNVCTLEMPRCFLSTCCKGRAAQGQLSCRHGGQDLSPSVSSPEKPWMFHGSAAYQTTGLNECPLQKSNQTFISYQERQNPARFFKYYPK